MITELHCHTTASDGTLTPAELVELAVERQVAILAITDHDTTGAWEEAGRAAAGRLELWPGIEINCDEEGREIHLLGYFIDPEHPTLQQGLADLRAARAHRMVEMVERLNALGVKLSMDEVRVHTTGQSPGRPHLARAMIAQGLVGDVNEAFDRYLGHGQPAYVPRYNLEPPRAIELIRAAGGHPVWAHPGLSVPDPEEARARFERYRGHGLAGVEVYYPRHSAGQVEFFRELSRRHGLLVTGGSDFHGPEHGHPVQLGQVRLPEEDLQRLREAGGRC